jgi:hypothetical protein
MGCDIHCYVERVHPAKGWVPVNPPKGNSESRYNPDGSYNHNRKVDWEDWGRWVEEEAPLKKLADLALEKVDIIPEQANDWAFGRNYEAFGQLAGVRSGCEPFEDLRHVPDDISDPVFREGYQDSAQWGGRQVERFGQTWYFGPDWHSPTWYDLDDLKLYSRGSELRIRQLRDELKKVAKTYGLQGHQVRVVLWFDN